MSLDGIYGLYCEQTKCGKMSLLSTCVSALCFIWAAGVAELDIANVKESSRSRAKGQDPNLSSAPKEEQHTRHRLADALRGGLGAN